MLYLNIGSGQRKFTAPWTNIDTQAKWEPDICSDGLSCLRTLQDNTVQMICLHHVLEHFGCGEAGPIISECQRVLVPGGSLLVFVPDMLALARMWIEGKISNQIYMTNVYGAYMDDEADRHKWGYTSLSLRLFISDYFKLHCVRQFDWRPIAGADIARDTWILGVEAWK